MSKPLKIIGQVAAIAALIPGPHQPFAMAISVAANIGSQLLAKPPPARGSVSQMLIQPNAPQPYVMGEGHFAGVLRHRAGYGGTVDDVENPYLFDVVVYGGGGPYESITPQIDFAAVPAWYSGFLTTDTQLGACPEADALTGSFGSPTGWGAGYKLSGQAAIAWNMKFDKKGKKFASGPPQTGALIEGAKVYDPRLDSTFPGGSGTHVLGDESTYEYSDNPALHAAMYAYGRYQNGGKRVLGIGLPADGIDWQVVADWANVCETNSWTMFGVAFEPGDKGQNLIDICAAGGGEPVPGGKLSFRYHAPVVALDTVTEEDIADEDMTVVAMQSYRDRVNIVKPVYRSADHNWEMVQAGEVTDEDFVTEDGEERPIEWPFNFVKDVNQAAQLAAYKLFDARELHPIEIVCKPRLRAYRPGDCLELDLPQLGLATDAIILHREIDPATMKVRLTLIGETPAKHAFALGLTGDAPPTPAIGQDSEDRDETADSAQNTPVITVADEAAMVALGGPRGQVVNRTDNGESYGHNGGTSGTAADWTLIGTAAFGTAGSLDFDIDGTLAANSDALIATQKATKTYVDTTRAGLLEWMGGINCAANPNYPAAIKGDTYYVTVAGKIGGASGSTVEAGDVVSAKENTAGGDEATAGGAFMILQKNLVGALVASNNLSDLASAATARTNLGLLSMAIQAASAVAITGGTITGITSLSVTPAANKTFSAQNVTSSGVGDFSTGGAGVALSRPTDGVTALVGFYAYQSSGGTTNFVVAARGDVVLATGGGGLFTAAIDRVWIKTGGSVGVGTNNPGRKLEINDASGNCLRLTYNDADGSAANYVDLSVTSSGDYLITPSGGDTSITGNLGVGTTAPGRKVEINDASGNCLRLTYNDSDGSAANYADLQVSSSGDLTITPSGGDVNVVGNLGVGEAAPDYKLDVNGTFGFTPGASVTPADNGDVVFEFTNNTTVTVKGKGSDGTVRTVTLTLA